MPIYLPRRAALFAILAAAAGCGPALEPVTAPQVTPSASAAPSTSTSGAAPKPAPSGVPSAPSARTIDGAASSPVFDPVPRGMTPEGVQQICSDHLKAAEAILTEIKSLKGAPPEKLTFEATLGRFDDLIMELNNAHEFPYLMGVAHPDEKVRDAGKKCEPRTEKFMTATWLDAGLAAVVKAYAAKGEALEGERARLLRDTLRDFKRNGIDLAPEKQQRLREINEGLTVNGQRFIANIGASNDALEIDLSSLAGLPPEYVAKHAPNAKGKAVITTDYPDYYPFLTYAKDRKAAAKLYALFTNRGGDKNLKILEVILRLRSEKAKLLGYANWADYVTETRMAKSAKGVRAFLDTVQADIKDAAKAEMSELLTVHARDGGSRLDKLPPYESYYLEDRVKQTKFKFDSIELSSYLEVGAVTQGLLDITAKMYGLEYRRVQTEVWHPDVSAYEVWSGKELIGKFYLDLYSRPNKYKHAAMFSVRGAKRLKDGSYQRPIAALECNFPKPGAQPALMQHEDVVTFFHEFGHVLHHLLTRSELASYAGTVTARDFVEAPSQMFEEWAWSREVLDVFAKHFKTGDKIPDALYDSMQKSRTFGRALATQRQIFLAKLDLEYHTREPGFDTTRVLQDVQSATDSFVFVRGTHAQSSFSHLIGYDAGYYGYQWALAIAQDVLTRFKKEGLLNPTTAASWRDEVLSKGGGADERTMIAKFLGREPNQEAYINYIKGAP